MQSRTRARDSVQGSGKSTFAKKLLDNNAAFWTRVNQDTLKSKQKCVSVMTAALKARENVIIDRCNFDFDQRATWLDIAGQRGLPCYLVWLALPRDVAAQRAQQRVRHEGSLTGPEAANASKGFHHRIMGALSLQSVETYVRCGSLSCRQIPAATWCALGCMVLSRLARPTPQD